MPSSTEPYHDENFCSRPVHCNSCQKSITTIQSPGSYTRTALGEPLKTNALQLQVTRQIFSLVRRERFEPGDRLVITSLANKLGVSRTPVKAALDTMKKMGVISYEKNKGFFLIKPIEEIDHYLNDIQPSHEDDIYRKIASLHLSGTIPNDTSEIELMRILGTGRSTLKKCLGRILQEGWVERSTGHGWTFLPVIDSIQAYNESYYFRITVEPSAILSPDFNPDRNELEELLAEQHHISDIGHTYMTSSEFYDANIRFHETILKWSNNRFILQSIRRLNQLRRLAEYQQNTRQTYKQLQTAEHVDILLSIKKMDYLGAAALMRRHLERARQSKSRETSPFTNTES